MAPPFLHVELKMGAVVVGFRWHMAAFSSCRLSPAYHDPVSHPPIYCGDLFQLKSVDFHCKSADHFRTRHSTLY